MSSIILDFMADVAALRPGELVGSRDLPPGQQWSGPPSGPGEMPGRGQAPPLTSLAQLMEWWGNETVGAGSAAYRPATGSTRCISSSPPSFRRLTFWVEHQAAI